jgi:hypothetical protein
MSISTYFFQKIPTEDLVSVGRRLRSELSLNHLSSVQEMLRFLEDWIQESDIEHHDPHYFQFLRLAIFIEEMEIRGIENF